MLLNNEMKEYWDVCPKWTKEDVEKKAKEYGIDLPTDSFENRWAMFGNVLARENGLNDITAASMAYVVSMFLGGMGVSAGTDAYFNEENIDYAVFDKLNELNIDDDVELMNELLSFILDLYLNHIGGYEYRNIRWELRITQSELDKLKDVPGKTRADKFRTLLDHWSED